MKTSFLIVCAVLLSAALGIMPAKIFLVGVLTSTLWLVFFLKEKKYPKFIVASGVLSLSFFYLSTHNFYYYMLVYLLMVGLLACFKVNDRRTVIFLIVQVALVYILF